MEADLWKISLKETLQYSVTQIPYLAVLLVGLILAFVFIRRHPAVCALAVGSFLILVIEATVVRFLSTYLVNQAAYVYLDRERWEKTMLMMAWISGAARAVALAMLVGALYGWRGRQTELWYD